MLIRARVKTNSKKFEIVRKNGILHISLMEKAENNRANAELAREMARKFGSCRIVRGLKSRTKTLELPDDSDLKSPKGLIRKTKLSEISSEIVRQPKVSESF